MSYILYLKYRACLVVHTTLCAFIHSVCFVFVYLTQGLPIHPYPYLIPPCVLLSILCVLVFTLYADLLHIATRGQSIITVSVFLLMQSCADPTTRPSCLSEKQLEGAIKHVVKRFPNIDTKVRCVWSNTIITLAKA